MRLHQLEGVIRRGADALVFVGEQNRVQHVHHLRDVAHVQLLGLAIENVQAEPGGHGAAHGFLLPQAAVTLLVFGGHAIPHAPLIQKQPDAAIRIVAVEQIALLDNRLLDAREGIELRVHRFGRVFERR